MKIAILGAGAWGTALGLVLEKNGHEITLWSHHAEGLRKMQSAGRNERYLPEAPLPSTWLFEPSLGAAIRSAGAVVKALPSKGFRSVAEQLEALSCPIISVTKGIEYETNRTMTEVLRHSVPKARVSALSGPTFALEVARGFPCAIVAASTEQSVAAETQAIFHRTTFRVYTSTDVLGVELGGALKNVIAIAAGVGDGLGFGDSSKAALVTRALAEMRRLGLACGALPDTFAGLSGLGDLTVTCFSVLSRNRRFGERLGRGEKLEVLLARPKELAEGYPTARSAYQLARKIGVETPIIDEVYAMLYEGKNIVDSLRDLTARSSKPE
jgi:glycerol-3-phosphate dehydrogenase (NAD(P)+)